MARYKLAAELRLRVRIDLHNYYLSCIRREMFEDKVGDEGDGQKGKVKNDREDEREEKKKKKEKKRLMPSSLSLRTGNRVNRIFHVVYREQTQAEPVSCELQNKGPQATPARKHPTPGTQAG